MVSTLSRCLRGYALAMAVTLLAGCTRTILGTVHPVTPGAKPAPIRVADLLIEPGQFPPRYPAVVLDAVTMTVLPAPPVDADDSYAVDQTVTDESSGSMRTTLTLAAQIGDVRVSATWLHDGTPDATPDVAPDTQALDTLFADAVLKVRRVGGP